MSLWKCWKSLLWVTCFWVWLVIMLGAYVRLSHAGLGCPDWPGCYGYFWMPATPDQVQAAHLDFPDQRFFPLLALKEMLHRYAVGVLSIFILLLCGMSFFLPGSRLRMSIQFSGSVLVILLFQALLGMWTVTLKLMPMIVTLHLLGGMSLLAVLSIWLSYRALRWSISHVTHRLLGVLIGTLILQIFLGGWLSTNYAALFCGGYPLCEGRWIPEMDFRVAFQPWRLLHKTVDLEPLPTIAYVTIHWVHRWFAIVVLMVLLVTALFLYRDQFKGYARSLCLLGASQVLLGILNVWWQLPLSVAVLHNGVAALLLAMSCYIWARTQ